MDEMKKCQKCGAPHWITTEHLWLNNGDIVLRGDQRNRLVLFESENIDPLFHNIQDLLGIPIDHITTTAVRRAVRSYTSSMIPDEIKEQVRELKLDSAPILTGLMSINILTGVGRVELVELRYQGEEGDYGLVRMIKPYSVPLAVGGIIGGGEALYGREMGYDLKRTSPDTYEINLFPSPHPEELKERMWFKEYQHRDGTIELERCPSCGGPSALSRYSWDLEEGIVMDKDTNRRMIMLGPYELDIVFEELEKEIGATIPRVIVEAQRRFTKNSARSLFDVTTAEEFRVWLAVTGMGYLKDIDVSRKGLSMYMENAALPLMMVGIMQGVYEKALKQDTICEWHISGENDLEINIIALAH